MNGSPLSDDDEPDGDDEPDESDEAVAKFSRRASTTHVGRSAGSRNIKWAVECDMPLSDCSLAEVKLGMMGHNNLIWRRTHGGDHDCEKPCIFNCASHAKCNVQRGPPAHSHAERC